LPKIKEQQVLGLGYEANGKVELRDAAAAENKALPIHRWVPWIAGFSAKFVQDAIDAYLTTRNRHRQLILDPFAGVGTTLVESLKAGRNTVGYELNRFAALAARAKVESIDIAPENLRADVDAFRSSLTRFESRVDREWRNGGTSSVERILARMRTTSPPGFRSRIPFFSPPVQAKFLYALEQVSSVRTQHEALFRAALGATMISYSNYTYEPSLSSRPGADKPLIENASVCLPVCQKLDIMAEDISWAREYHGSTWSSLRREVYAQSYFTSRLPRHAVSLVVTSPPYMNNYHYLRNTRPQLHWLQLIEGPEDLRAHEHESFGKFWQTVRHGPRVDLNFEFAPLNTLLRRLRTLSVERGQYGGPGWANYVATYFNDCARFLDIMGRQLKPGGHAVVVIGNSIIQGVEFRVDELLAELAEIQGFTVVDVRHVRTKRVGNSIIDSSVRNGKGPKKGTQLYDAAVILRA